LRCPRFASATRRRSGSCAGESHSGMIPSPVLGSDPTASRPETPVITMDGFSRRYRRAAVAAVVVIFPFAAGAVPVAQAAAQTGSPAAGASVQEQRRAPHGRVLPEPEPSGRRYEAARRYQAPEARQGVAVDTDHFYAIANYRIARYEKGSGA